MTRWLTNGAALVAVWAATGATAADAPRSLEAIAAAFGARPLVQAATLSPDGSHVAFIAPAAGKTNVAMVIDVAKGEPTAIGRASCRERV